MGKVIGAAVMSLDGYIAKHGNSIGRLFDWYISGDVRDGRFVHGAQVVKQTLAVADSALGFSGVPAIVVWGETLQRDPEAQLCRHGGRHASSSTTRLNGE